MNINSIAKFITTLPENVPQSDRRIFIFSALIYICGFLVHKILFVFFGFMGIEFMMYYNVLSFITFALCFYLNYRGFLKFAFTLMVAEITLHSVLSVYTMGWNTGFQFFLLFIPPIIFINSTLKILTKIIYGLAVTLIFIGMYYLSKYHQPLYVLPEEILNYVYVVSLLAVFVTFCVLGYFFSLAVINAEKSLESANDNLASANEELVDIYSELKVKNDQVLSSINYAKTLQTTILPTNEELREYFGNCELIFLPKDYVSGDFYWVRQIMNKRFIIAVADCTGHGVPGAMISMVGNMILTEIIVSAGVITPNIILELLNERIREVLKQDEGDSFVTDGMDIALIDIDLESGSLVYSGAKRPLLVRKDGELLLIEPSKSSIGGKRSKEAKFTANSLNLSKGDEIVLFTDGITDQNNENRKKFGIGKLKELMVNLNDKKALKEEFLRFKGAEEQRDDVTLLYLKV
jgi:serine phosphatase RsbU (regulator of sigma subunit)